MLMWSGVSSRETQAVHPKKGKRVVKRLSPVVRKIIAVYLAFVLLALLFVPGAHGSVFLPIAISSYINYRVLTLEILLLTVAAAFALVVASLLSSRHGNTH
jgi:polyferredoxin